MKQAQNYLRLTKRPSVKQLTLLCIQRTSGVHFPLVSSPVNRPCHLDFKVRRCITNRFLPIRSAITTLIGIALRSLYSTVVTFVTLVA